MDQTYSVTLGMPGLNTKVPGVPESAPAPPSIGYSSEETVGSVER